MSLDDRLNLTSFQSLRRIALSILTFFVLIKLIFALGATIDRPQIQGKFELYQTNLVLEAAEWKPTADLQGLAALQTSLVGADFLKSATEQYQTARKTDVKAVDQLSTSLTDPELTDADPKSAEFKAVQIRQTIAAAQTEIDRIDLRIGILQTAQKQPETAIKTWQKIVSNSTQSKSQHTAASLIDIWQKSSSINANTVPQIEAEINSNFDGWFRDRVLHQLYLNVGDKAELSQLDRTEQATAENALIKLATIFASRVLFGLGGLGLIIYYIVRLIIRLIQKESTEPVADLVLTGLKTPWTAPWDWEIVWQVFMVGFFFVGQFLLPLIFSQFVNPSKLTTQSQAIYVFSSYAIMAGLGIGVLYLSIKSYFPLPPDWFKFNWKSNWILWGVGGYLVATPIVIVVSLLNEQIWKGQGGSNPILQIVLEGKDPIALLLFFLTAAVAAPLFEEFLFRGFLLPSLTRYVPVWGSIGLSGLLFGVAHLSFSEIIPLTTLGIILGVVYTRTRNLLAPMLLHSLWNSTTLISLYILGSGS
jgi:uncharacterized protein